MHRSVAGMFGFVALLSAAPGLSQTASNSGIRSEYRLTEDEKERILADAEAKGRNPATKDEAIDLLDRPAIRGEVGFSIGTDGSRSAFGSAFFPLGGAGGAMISIDMDRFGDVTRRQLLDNPYR